MALAAGLGPISLREASMAAEPGIRPKLRLAASTNLGSPKTGKALTLATETPVTFTFCWLPKNRLYWSWVPQFCPSRKTAVALEVEKMLFIAIV